ncbi:hypothetical protein MMC06_003635 [Schaereria dolodes]|nr:hypothetical protein [Schaereria dolodes]
MAETTVYHDQCSSKASLQRAPFLGVSSIGLTDHRTKHQNSILFGIGALVYSNYIYNTYIIRAFHTFPEPVANKLRRALYYTNIDLQPKKAIDYYRQALAVADEVRMDPFSDEVLGIKIQLASLMEKIHQYQKAINVLEIVRADCVTWMEKMGGKIGNEGNRTRVLGKMVGINVKLGELYSIEYIADLETAEERLIWAVETLLKEQRRREDEGVKEGEGQWMSNEEIGGALELNNLSISLALQSPPSAPNTPPASPTTQISSAQAWGNKALSLASSITGPRRTEECDKGCAVATHNLGEFAEMDKNLMEAKMRYEGAKALSRAIGFKEGITNAEQGLRRVNRSV